MKILEDSISDRLMREPRGHPEMYGAIIVHETELTASGEADVGVLFCHNGAHTAFHADLLGLQDSRGLLDYVRACDDCPGTLLRRHP